MVALLAEGVDRNWIVCGLALSHQVALLAEGVDRNIRDNYAGQIGKVALLAEGVDRNIHDYGTIEWAKKSPSSRRAWIEILAFILQIQP